ncbi:SMP-30/gluconolactonase/LRE family protein [Oscillatoria sp. CS-180]|uniref:SMP-30/gluconolactonase/LRE family protein n=1 Tax=Oscillatoria sp. CS-180 TaxID=3021720 RepID=UPI00232EDBC5|nr:SMP-30/gluconolactonase/LRE family protein [Oscillatoria sp. CS-180]MDB9524622.1 SMP-30/gluconolactonase/LRE family protein [Oscillatoria sp. CS-180]
MDYHSCPQNVLSARARLGEGPIWDNQRQVLYWVDIYNRRVHTFDPATAEDLFVEIDTVVSGLFIADEHQVIIAQEHGLSFLNLQTGSVKPLVSVEKDKPNNRLNDVRCDRKGRLWIGTMNNHEQPEANLYRYDPDGSLHPMETRLTISNGLGWSPNQKTFYLTDTPRKTIYAYEFDLETGKISARRPLINLTHEPFYPDGLTLDSEGCIWSAMWNGWCVIRFDPDGKEMGRIQLPVPLVTSCTFGGADLTDLFITTGSAGLSQAELKQSYEAGDLFCLNTDVKGLPSDRYGPS